MVNEVLGKLLCCLRMFKKLSVYHPRHRKDISNANTLVFGYPIWIRIPVGVFTPAWVFLTEMKIYLIHWTESTGHRD